MKSTRLLGLTGLLIGGAIVLAACGGGDEEIVPTPVFEPTAAPAARSAPAPTATSAPAPTPVFEPTAAPAATSAPAPTTAPTTAPTAAPTAAPVTLVGDAVNGEALFAVQGCSGCHSTGANRVVGPGLSGVGTTAETRVAGLNADEYLTQSIKSPNAFVVPDFFADLMPTTFGQTLSEQEIADIVAYLISLP